MSLLSIDITKVKRLSLLEIKPPEQRAVERPAPEAKAPAQVDAPKLTVIAHKIIAPENNYTKEEIIARLLDETKVSQERAENGFNLMIQAGAIEQTTVERLYNLGGSTPF